MANVVPVASVIVLAAPGQSLPDYLRTWGIPAVVIGMVLLFAALKSIVDGIKAASSLIASPFRLARRVRAGRRIPRDERQFRTRVARLLLQNLDFLEAELHWQREHFVRVRVNLEAAEGAQAGSRSPGSRLTGTFRTNSLERMIQHYGGQCVLLQGDAGAGKSVALRALARQFLEHSQKDRQGMAPLALCVSLRDLHVGPDEVNVGVLTEYIERQLNVRRAPDLIKYFESHFTDDLNDGRVILLLDSFDEIPAVLGSANIDRTVAAYVEAIANLRGGGRSTCVLASRVYRAPRVPGWANLELLGLTYEGQRELLAAYGLSPDKFRLIEGLLLDPRRGFTADLRNPLYLALLAEFMETHAEAPGRPTELFDSYVRARLSQSSFASDERTLELIAACLQRLAFELTEQADRGLVAEVEAFLGEIRRQLPLERQNDAEAVLESMRRSKLIVEVESAAFASPRTPVAFAHRRILEYFATRYVIMHPTAVSTDELVTNMRWRETAVAMLQVGSVADKQPLLAGITAILEEELVSAERETDFAWQPTTVHVLEILVAAYGSDSRDLPASLRSSVDRYTARAWSTGTIGDRKFALDCAPVLSGNRQSELLQAAFSGRSEWLRFAALRDCSALHPLPDEVDSAIRRLLITLAGRVASWRDTYALDADLRRLYTGEMFVRIRRFVSAAPYAVITLGTLMVIFDFAIGYESLTPADLRSRVLYGIALPFLVFSLLMSNAPFSYPTRSRVRRVIDSIVNRWFGWSPDDMSAEPLMTLITGLIAFLVVVDVAFGVAGVLTGSMVVGIYEIVVRPVLNLHLWGWGPALLYAVNQRRLSSEMRFREVAGVAFRSIPLAVRGMRRSWRQIVAMFSYGLVLQVVYAALWFGVTYLLVHFAGKAGHLIVKMISVAFLLLLPVIIALAIVREILSRRRVRRRAALTLTADRLIDGMCHFHDPVETAEFLRALRLRRTRDVTRLPRPLIRELCILIESASSSGYDVPASLALARILGQRRDWTPPPDLDPVLQARIDDGQLNEMVLTSWQGEVLDQLGQIDELLRER